MKTRSLCFAVTLVLAERAVALGPHETLLLVNENASNSVEIASCYAGLRSIPASNVVRLRAPPGGGAVPVEITPQEFTDWIWAPATRVVRDRGIGDHILAWVYSSDFPIRVRAATPMSVGGLTFLRGVMPDAKAAHEGTYASPLFAGASSPGVPRHFAQTFDVYRRWLGEDMPLPSMVLGYTGERGNSVGVVLRCLRRGVEADRTSPSGTVYFVRSDDARSRCREWQFTAAAKELAGMGLRADVGTNYPAGRSDILGLMAGSASVEPSRYGTYVPGSMADHLTSAAGAFDSAGQTKLTAWIEAGATASAGTVTEPYTAWTKFPNAWLYAYAVSGCTVIESYYQAIRCPLQILLVGDPLCEPWAPKAEMALRGLQGGATVSGTIRVEAEVRGPTGAAYGKTAFLLDDRVARGTAGGATLEVDTKQLAEGAHTLRAVGYLNGMVRNQVFREVRFEVRNGER